MLQRTRATAPVVHGSSMECLGKVSGGEEEWKKI